MNIVGFNICRFQFARDRVIGDSQVGTKEVHVAALELHDADGNVGLGFIQSLFHPLPSEKELTRIFTEETWGSLEGTTSGALAHRVSRPRGGNVKRSSINCEEAVQQAIWDLFAKSVKQPLWKLLGARRDKVRTYASGLDFHLDDDAFQSLFSQAAEQGFTAFKIKVGHQDFARDLKRLDLLKSAVGANATVMIDANEAWSPKQTIQNLEAMRKAGHEIYWAEDPILRDDFEGLRLLRETAGPTLINAGEYFGISDKRKLMMAGGADMLNVHGHVTDVMRIGWLAADMGVPVTLGNSFLEIGVNMALALPEVEWLEYSYQNFDHLVEKTYPMKDGFIWGSEDAGHGLILSEEAREKHRVPTLISSDELGPVIANPRLKK